MTDEVFLLGYDDWKDSIVTLHLHHGETLKDVIIVDLAMSSEGIPHTLASSNGAQIFYIPFQQVEYYEIVKRSSQKKQRPR